VPGEQPKLDKLVKLNTNENPYGPSPRVLEAIQHELNDSLRLYPDPNSDRLRQTVATYYGLTPEQVFVGNSSDEVLAHTFFGLLKHDQPLLFPDITYSFYPVYCGIYEIDYRQIPLNERFEIQIDDYLQPNGGIIFPNPNAPTGCLLSLAEISRLLERNTESVVVVDEAYIDFGGESAAALVDRYPNLLVIQTLSKSRALAGLRVGFALGQAPRIAALARAKNSCTAYPLDRRAQAGAIAAMEDEGYFQEKRNAVIQSRAWLTAQLAGMGFECLPSAANFVFVRHPRHDGAKLAQRLRQDSIIVRHFKLPRIEQFLRITVGTEEQCRVLVDALRGIVG
jgi:histidinol-phosphate aminotransferase